MEITIPENEKTGLVDRIIAGLSSLIKPSPSDKDATTEKTETKPSDAQNAQVAALSAQVATLRATARRKDAETFVDGIIRSGRALPVEKDHMIALYIRAATDDDSTPIAPVRLSDGTVKNEPSRLELLKTGIESRPPFVAGLLNEKLPGDSIVLSTDAGKGDDDEEKAAVRQQNLMNRTPLGRKTMTRKVDK